MCSRGCAVLRWFTFLQTVFSHKTSQNESQMCLLMNDNGRSTSVPWAKQTKLVFLKTVGPLFGGAYDPRGKM